MGIAGTKRIAIVELLVHIIDIEVTTAVVDSQDHLSDRAIGYGSRLVGIIAIDHVVPLLLTVGVVANHKGIAGFGDEFIVFDGCLAGEGRSQIDILVLIYCQGCFAKGSTGLIGEVVPNGCSVVEILSQEELVVVLEIAFGLALPGEGSIAVECTGDDDIVACIDSDSAGLCTE